MKTATIKIKIVLPVIFLLFQITVNKTVAQTLNTCPISNEFSEYGIKLYFYDTSKEDKRIASGTNNIPLSEVRPVEIEIECNTLHNFLLNNLKYQRMVREKGQRKFFYQTNDFYYVFWINDPIGTGPKKIFFVVKKDFSETFEFYF